MQSILIYLAHIFFYKNYLNIVEKKKLSSLIRILNVHEHLVSVKYCGCDYLKCKKGYLISIITHNPLNIYKPFLTNINSSWYYIDCLNKK